MSLKRLEMISRSIHLCNNSEEPPSDSPDLFANFETLINWYIDKFLSNIFEAVYTPICDLRVDEQMSVPDLASTSSNACQKQKSVQIQKLWGSGVGHCLQFQIYTCKVKDKAEKDLAFQVVLGLMSPFI